MNNFINAQSNMAAFYSNFILQILSIKVINVVIFIGLLGHSQTAKTTKKHQVNKNLLYFLKTFNEFLKRASKVFNILII